MTASFAAVAKRYGVSVAICPPRRGNRKGVVEKINHTAAQRWWRTLGDDVTVEQAQASLDTFSQLRGDTRLRPAGPDGKASVAGNPLSSELLLGRSRLLSELLQHDLQRGTTVVLSACHLARRFHGDLVSLN